VWQKWRTALLVVQPERVLRWHRHWIRRRWAQRSKRIRPGRPRTDAATHSLVNPLCEGEGLRTRVMLTARRP
jgi:hypothetical protein